MYGNRTFIAGLLLLIVAAGGAQAPAGESAADHFNRGLALYERGHYEAAVEYFEQAVAGDPGQSRYHHWLGRGYGRLAEQSGWLRALSLAHRTRSAFERAVELDEHNREAIKDLAAFYEEAPGLVGGDPDKAEELRGLLAAIEYQDDT